MNLSNSIHNKEIIETKPMTVMASRLRVVVLNTGCKKGTYMSKSCIIMVIMMVIHMALFENIPFANSE
jgi:hypothetical protein